MERQVQPLRNPVYDILKAFAIFLVIWGHCIQHFLSTGIDNPVFRIIYAFHMPLFMMISGFFSYKSIQDSFTNLLSKKARQLLLPCLTWYLLAYLIPKIALLLISPNNGKDYDLTHLAYHLVQNFWFLKSVFVCYFLLYLGSKTSWTISVIVGLFFYSDTFNVSWLYPSFLLGYFLNKHQIINKFSKQIILPSGITFVVICIFFGGKIFFRINIFEALLDKDTITIMEYLYKNLYMIVIGISGSLFFISLFNLLFQNANSSRFNEWAKSVGQHTLPIYILQAYICSSSTVGRFIHFDSVNFYLYHFIIAPIIAIAVIVLCESIFRLTERSAVCKLLLWGMKAPNNKKKVVMEPEKSN